MVLFHLIEVAIFCGNPKQLKGQTYLPRGPSMTEKQVVPQVSAAEAAGQVLSNSVGRVMVEGEDEGCGGSKRSQGLGRILWNLQVLLKIW